jgi:hypothetical protein
MPVSASTSSVMTVNGWPMPSQYQDALRKGYQFFVLRYNKRFARGYETDKWVGGFFDCRVGVSSGPGGTPGYVENWSTGHNAGVWFLGIEDHEVAIAFVPDDPFFHNRMMIHDHPEFIIEGIYSNKEGFVQSGVVLEEMRCLREVICEEVPIWRVINPQGKEEDFFWTEAAADAFINETTTVPIGPNHLPHEVQLYKKCKKVIGKKLRKRPEIDAMIKANSKITYGWTNSLEFKTTVLPKVLKKMKECKAAAKKAGGGISQQDIINAISGLSKETLANLAALAEKKESVHNIESEGEEQTGTVVVDNTGIPHEPVVKKLTKSSLMQKNLSTLAEIAAEHGIQIQDGLTKPAIVDEILSKVNKTEELV